MTTPTIVNLTPHPIKLVSEDSSVIKVYEPSGIIARADQTDQVISKVKVNGIDVDVVTSAYGRITGLPRPQADTYFLVSAIIVQVAKASGRSTDDLLMTSSPVRDENGQTIGCRRFAVCR